MRKPKGTFLRFATRWTGRRYYLIKKLWEKKQELSFMFWAQKHGVAVCERRWPRPSAVLAWRSQAERAKDARLGRTRSRGAKGGSPGRACELAGESQTPANSWFFFPKEESCLKKTLVCSRGSLLFSLSEKKRNEHERWAPVFVTKPHECWFMTKPTEPKEEKGGESSASH